MYDYCIGLPEDAKFAVAILIHLRILVPDEKTMLEDNSVE